MKTFTAICCQLAIFIFAASTISAQDSRVAFSEFNFVGNRTLSSDELTEVLEEFQTKIITLEALQLIKTKVFSAYVDRGILAKISFPEQDVSDGSLLLKINEAELGEVSIVSEADLRLSTARAEKFIRYGYEPGSTLTTTFLDERTKILNSLYGVSADLKINPRYNSHIVDTSVEMANSDLLTSALKIDNLGSATTGEFRTTADISINSAFKYGEQLRLSYTKAKSMDAYTLGLEFQPNFDGRRLEIRKDTTKLKIMASDISLESETKALEVNYELPKLDLSDLPIKPRLYFSENKVRERGQIDGQSVLLKDESVRSISLEGSLSWIGADQKLALNSISKLTFGTADLSRIPSVLAADASGHNIHGDFFKLKVDVSGQFLLNDNWSISSVGSCQLANKNLSSSEKLTLSGIAGVRGWSGGDLSADIGCYLQSELVTQVSSEVGVFAGIDIGAAKINAKSGSIANSSNVKNVGSLSSFSAGVRGNNGSSLTYNLSYGVPISNCDICKQSDSDGQIYATVVLDL